MMTVNLNDRFTFPIDVYPESSWVIRKLNHRFELVLDYGNGQGRVSRHPTRECAEHAVRKFIEIVSTPTKYDKGFISVSEGCWEIREIGSDR